METVRRTKREVEALDKALLTIVGEVHPCTVRQVFYCAEVQGLVPKDEQGYGVVQRRLVRLRRAKRLPWGYIVDHARSVLGYQRWQGPDDFLHDMHALYRHDYWANASERVEVLIEKDALAGAISPVVVEEFGLDLYVSRGFASLSYLEAAAEVIREDNRSTVIYLLTDFDPSGLSIAHRIAQELPERADPVPVKVRRIACTQEQVYDMDLPTRPVKVKDTRARAFIEQYGASCCELDAIPPDALRALIRERLECHMDPETLAKLKIVEAEERRGLERLAGAAS